jgi:phosphoadenosine phosphosulfate reductase
VLIQCDKHKPDDLRLWTDYEEMDKINSKKESLKVKEKKAIEIIKDFSNRKQCYIGISWGKDSVTVADLAYRNDIYLPLVHLYCIPSHNKECDKVRDAFLRYYPGANYNEIEVDYSVLPGGGYEWTDREVIKKGNKIYFNGYKRARKMFGECHISGVRKEESGSRTIRMKRWGEETKYTLAPIGYWNYEEVFAYLYKYNLPVHSNYAMLGKGRFQRKNIRVGELGEPNGAQYDRAIWEKEYYNQELKRYC